MKTATQELAAVALVSAPAPVAPAPRAIKPVAPTASLLETVRALDGNKEDRFNVAHAALTVAYTLALTHGNKTQLTAMLSSTGKKVCEKAMRAAVQEVGVLGLHKDAVTREQAITDAVNVAVSLFAAVACVVKPATKKAAKVEAPATPTTTPAEGEQEAPAKVASDAAVQAAIATEQAIIKYAQGLSDAQLAALTDKLVGMIEQRTRAHTVPALKAA